MNSNILRYLEKNEFLFLLKIFFLFEAKDFLLFKSILSLLAEVIKYRVLTIDLLVSIFLDLLLKFPILLNKLFYLYLVYQN